jgi:hypothetical protein
MTEDEAEVLMFGLVRGDEGAMKKVLGTRIRFLAGHIQHPLLVDAVVSESSTESVGLNLPETILTCKVRVRLVLGRTSFRVSLGADVPDYEAWNSQFM